MLKLIKFIFCGLLIFALHWNIMEMRERGQVPNREMLSENIQTIIKELPTKDAAQNYIRENFPSLHAFSESVVNYVVNLENLLYDE